MAALARRVECCPARLDVMNGTNSATIFQISFTTPNVALFPPWRFLRALRTKVQKDSLKRLPAEKVGDLVQAGQI
jgi:hypothetical protein